MDTTLAGIKGEHSEFILTLDSLYPNILLYAGLYTDQLPSGEDGDWGSAPKGSDALVRIGDAISRILANRYGDAIRRIGVALTAK
jgi:hypothetical protein